MLSYKLHRVQGDFYYYHYYPNGDGTNGEITINKETGEIAIVKSSLDDFGNRFAFKMIKQLEYFFDTKEYKEFGTIIWY